MTYLVLSKSQSDFISLVVKEHGYLGKATTSDGRTIKLYRLQPSDLSCVDYTNYLTKEEFDAIPKTAASYIYSPYYKLVIRSFEDLLKLKNLTLAYKHVFYTEIPQVLLNDIEIDEKEKAEFIVDLNNGRYESRCRLCGNITTCTHTNCYYEYYDCINPHCSFTQKGN